MVLIASAQQPPHWREWSTKDGLVEGHSRYLQIDREGNVWITHGAVNSFSQLDGLTVKRIPRGDQFGKIMRGADGQIWVDDSDGFRKFEHGEWQSYPVREIAEWKQINKMTDGDRFFYYPLSSEAILYLMPQRVALYNPQTRQSQIIKDANQTRLSTFLELMTRRNGELLVAGKKGYAYLRLDNKAQFEWKEQGLAETGLETLESIVEGADGTLYFTGSVGAKKRRLVKFDGRSWKMLYEGEQPFLRGWAEADGSVWLQCATTILRWHNHHLQEIERHGALSGAIFNVRPAEPGTFWVATTQGLMRHAPAIWRTPDNFDAVDNVVHSFYEDPLGRIWVAATNSLLLYEHGKWQRFPVPNGNTTYTYLTRSMNWLPNGKLLVRLDQAPTMNLFNPSNGQFEEVKHPLGRRMHVNVTRQQGGVWLWTLDQAGKSRLELYDGQEFKTVMELDGNLVRDGWGGVRDILETRNGDVWIGSLGGVGIYHEGRFSDFSTNPEVMKNGAFYLLELRNGKVWVGGREKIYEYDHGNWRVVLQGIDKVRSMIEARDGTIWVAASSGIYRYKHGTWLANSQEDGLPATIAYSVFEDSQGHIWAGTTRGLTSFHPDADLDPPDTFISDEDNLRDAPPSGEIRLVFSGIDKWKYTLSDRLLFSTRIDGQPWSEFMTAQEAIFKGLSAGAHRFEVRAMDRNGNIDATPAVFDFNVLLPWYREMGFLLILSLGSIAILILTGLAVSNYRQRGKFIQELDQARERYLHLFDSNPFPMWVYDLKTLEFLTVNQSAINHYGYSLEEFQTMTLMDIRFEEDQHRLRKHLATEGPEYSSLETWRHRKKDGSIIEVEINTQEFMFAGRPARLVVINDITERRELERQLQQAQKLESIGQLAAGIAHEINTPTQFVNDNTVFLRDAFTDLSRVIEKDSELLEACQSGLPNPELVAAANSAAQEADLEYLLTEIPNAIQQTLEGTSRIARIVQSMKDFSHPGTNHKQPSDLNHAIQSTITVTQNEWKYVAEVETDFDSNLPPVPCLLGEFNQVILNIIVNAAHAIAEVTKEGSAKGKIRVTTRRDGEWAEITISDTGPGIPEQYHSKIFDPFFTTKEIGKGTGQGLAIAHRVMKKHNGTLSFKTEIGKGTTFTICLPLYE